MPIEIIKNNREMILKGEIGALLHDIGKCHPDFVKSKSIEKTASDNHAQIDKFLDPSLLQYLKDSKFEIKVNSKTTTVYNLITNHHDRSHQERNSRNELINMLIGCDRLDSADDKGIVREKQSIENTIIASPFGYPKEIIDLNCLQKRFEDLENNLIGIFKDYISEHMDLSCFRASLITNLKTAFSHALGETRIPSNDVTIFDHSYSTASLFKSVLCAIALGENPDTNELQWRLLGFCWDGIGFINKGRKVADIQKRNEIIEQIKNELKKKFEDEIPIGNAIYEDINGIYFTFPALADDKAKEFAKECVKEGLEIIRKKTDNEIWPFFTLSKPSRTLTILAKELKFASEKRNIPKISPMIFFENDKDHWNSAEIDSSLDLDNELENEIRKIKSKVKGVKIDICPICRLRPKDENGERCEVCENRRRGRLSEWLNSRENTIWTDEVADVNNRLALITLNFDLDKWLDGTMIGTIYSQSFEGWKNSGKWKNIQNTPIEANKNSVYKVVNKILRLRDSGSKKESAKLLDTFFEENIGLDKNSLDKHLSNIQERIGADNLTKENLATYLFTQNPSPARLYRIWRETEEFFELVVKEIKSELYSQRWKRIRFKVAQAQNLQLKENTPYIIKVKKLQPESILVLHTSNGQFYTIESLEKFKSDNKTGEEAVREALSNGFEYLALEDEPNKNLLKEGENIKPSKEDIEVEEYYPFIEITKSPLSLRLIVPALDSIKILELVIKLYNERFRKVIGKLPLNIGLLVSKRKFPLYVLLEAGERMLQGEEFKKPVMMDVWWNLDGIRNDEYYRFYPTKILKDDEKYTLDDLIPLSNGRNYALNPGFFDFDFLLATTDRYNITYKTYKGQRRAGEDYSYYSARPYYFYQISQIIKLWEILKNSLSSSQINYIEETLTCKLREWRNVNDSNKECVFTRFEEATLKDAFANRWEKLRKETQDFIINSALNKLLLDTIVLFRHIIKQKEDEENE